MSHHLIIDDFHSLIGMHIVYHTKRSACNKKSYKQASHFQYMNSAKPPRSAIYVHNYIQQYIGRAKLHNTVDRER